MTQNNPEVMDETMQQNMDEIDLFDLVDDVKEQWHWLVGVGLACALLALVYAFVATPVYQAELVYKPVNDTELLQLNQPRLKEVLGVAKDSQYLKADEAFREVRAQALSGTAMGDFYTQLLSEDDAELKKLIHRPNLTAEQNINRFGDLFTSVDSKTGEDLSFKLKLELADAELSARVLNRFSQFVLHKQAQEVQENISMRVNVQIEQWQLEAEKLRAEYNTTKQKRLLELQEAARIAATINQQRPVFDGERFAVGVEPPLYMMGEKALRAEIVQLNSRKQNDEDNYIKGLPELLWKIKNAQALKLSWGKVKYVQIDRAAVIPTSPIKPKKLLIVALGVVAGAMLGVFAALLTAAYQRRLERKRERKAAQV